MSHKYFLKVHCTALWLSLPGIQGIQDIVMEHFRDEQTDAQP